MFQWAGVSVAMAHGWPIAKQSATMIAAAGAPETALARDIEAILQNAAQI
jgi:hydroxymethylpyrimidine pyrophosphatase-like HAD family hydrolase